MKKILTLMLVIQLVFVSSAWAQGSAEDDFVKSTQNDLMLVAGAGVAGGILGLSTLSFVDKPSQHLANIWTGAAIGVIAGVIWVAYNSAQRGQEGLEMEEASLSFETNERVAWHQENFQKLTSQEVQFGTGIYSINF